MTRNPQSEIGNPQFKNPRTEARTVQRPLIRYAAEIGWSRVSRDEAQTLRRGEAGTLFYEVLAERLKALNPGVVDDSNVEEILKRIEHVRSNIQGNREVLAWLQGRRSIFDKRKSQEVNIKVVDFENPGNNVFQITDEWYYTNGKFGNRADVMLLLNGIPVALVETKAADVKDGVDKGIEQVRRYHDETPEMVAAPQVFDVPNIVDFWYGVTWNLDRKNLFNWRDEEPGNFERKVKRFFDRERFLRMLKEHIVFIEKDDDLKKLILRQHQTRAVEKLLDRAREKRKPRALVWHTQGSGKTLTMMTVARELLTRPEFDNPTVLMLVDRNELESQLFGNLKAFGLSYQETKTKEHLRELFRADFRGLIVSMIHKFDKADANLCTRENVFVLVDEAHRTTTGDLGNYLVAALPKATLMGFTGTPIDRIAYGKGTFKVFGRYDEKGYLDKYSIAESIQDGTTVPIRYTLAPSEIRVPRKQLEKEFLDLAEAEGVSDIEDLNRILDRAVSLKSFLKAKDRVEKVARFVAEHFRQSVEPLGYKALLVGVDREACALYKEALDRLLPPEYSRVVYTPVHNDTPDLKKYYLADDEEKRVRKAFVKRDALPKILIVTEKLLTGFDAPVLYAMYLDKPMRDHTLLQAIARVNRPYEDEKGIEKPCGLVVDFVGVFENMQKALAFDSDDVASVIENIDVLKTRFEDLLKTQGKQYLQLAKGPNGDKAVERALDFFSDKERRDAFFEFYRDLETLYEIISPDPFLRPYLDDYFALSRLYQLVLNARSVRPMAELMRKTEEMVRQRVTAEGLTSTLPLYEINEETLEAIKKDSASDNTKILSLARSLSVTVDTQRDQQPYLIPLGERARAVLEHYDGRQMSTKDALRELERLIQEYNQARRERASKGFDINTFSIYWTLKKNNVKNPEAVAAQVETLFRKYPNHKLNPAELRLLKPEMYKLLMPAVGRDKMIELVERLLKLERRAVS